MKQKIKRLAAIKVPTMLFVIGSALFLAIGWKAASIANDISNLAAADIITPQGVFKVSHPGNPVSSVQANQPASRFNSAGDGART